MARGDLLVSLVRASVSGDKDTLQTAVEQIIAEEKGKQHDLLANRLSEALYSNGNGTKRPSPAPYNNGGRGREFLAEIIPKQSLDDMFLSEQMRGAVNQLIEEQRRREILQAHGLDPRHRIMLVGPPGNGKTSLAEAIAEALLVPFFVIRYESLIGSYLGETAGRLKNVFDYIRTTPCVIFFDEFDAIGKERGDTHETGEIKRVVSSLLMQVDELPSYTVVIAASNHAELLDRAVWRRFQLRLSLLPPNEKELAQYLKRYFDMFDWGRRAGIPPETLANRLGDTSYAEAEEFLLDVKRREVLSMSNGTPLKTIFGEQLNAWQNRANPTKQEENME